MAIYEVWATVVTDLKDADTLVRPRAREALYGPSSYAPDREELAHMLATSPRLLILKDGKPYGLVEIKITLIGA